MLISTVQNLLEVTAFEKCFLDLLKIYFKRNGLIFERTCLIGDVNRAELPDLTA